MVEIQPVKKPRPLGKRLSSRRNRASRGLFASPEGGPCRREKRTRLLKKKDGRQARQGESLDYEGILDVWRGTAGNKPMLQGGLEDILLLVKGFTM